MPFLQRCFTLKLHFSLDFNIEYGSQHLVVSGNPKFQSFKGIREGNFNSVIIAHLNISSMTTNIELLASKTVENIDILVISKRN